MLGLAFDGSALDERFLAADLALEEPFPPERQAWFDPPGHPGRTLLLHPQPDAMLRAELSLGPEPDPDTDRRPEVAARRLASVLGERPFRLVSASVYAFHARRLARLVHGRVIFAGDSAHTLPPFGARGANGGLADAASLAPCLAGAGDLGDYDCTRTRAADENLAAAAEAAAFLSPRSRGARALRDEALSLAAVTGQARAMVNAGRLGP
jgi:3-(3-hydroxy-phenyl)propionate hydroxylase